MDIVKLCQGCESIQDIFLAAKSARLTLGLRNMADSTIEILFVNANYAIVREPEDPGVIGTPLEPAILPYGSSIGYEIRD